jgi:hypothetical protein
MILLEVLIAIFIGAVNPSQLVTNVELNRELGRPIWHAWPVYAIGGLNVAITHVSSNRLRISEVAISVALGATPLAAQLRQFPAEGLENLPPSISA